MSHRWRLGKEIFLYVNVGVVMSPSGRKSKGGLSAVCCSAVRTQCTLAIRQIALAPLSHIYKNYWLSNVTIQHADNLPSSCAQSCTIWYTHNLWCGDICCRVNTLIDVRFPERCFESQLFADADGRSSSLIFVRTVTFNLQKISWYLCILSFQRSETQIRSFY